MQGGRKALAGALCAAFASGALAQDAANNSPGSALPTLDVIATTPLSGSGVDVDKVPGAVTAIDSRAIVQQRSPNAVAALAARTPSVDVQSVSGNAFQPDVYFRGFDASPVAGTPQGLAVYQDGVRINGAFGDVVNWDLIPTVAIRTIDVVSANPVFGLNALGGALSIDMKDGFGFQGLALDAMGGSFGRLQSSLQYGKQFGDWATYLAVEGVQDGGFRRDSATSIERVYGDLGYKGDSSEFHLSLGAANNTFGATASAPAELLQRSWSSVYTTPQTSHNQAGYLQARGAVTLTPTWSVQANAYLRSFYQTTVDGNATNAQACTDGVHLCFGNAATPAYGLGGAWLIDSFPSAATLGEIDRSTTRSTSLGATVQATDIDKVVGHDNHLVLGSSLDYGVTDYTASAELGTIQPDFSVLGSGIFLGPSGNPVADGPVSLRATNTYLGFYASDEFDATDRLSLTAGARFNIADIRLADQLGTALDGHETYAHINPMVGATYKLAPEITLYAGVSQSNRAPTPLELGCADPAHPCVLANFLVSDPALKQVVATTYEAGLRGRHDFGADIGALSWKLGAYRTDSANDILNVADPLQQGFGYFVNVGTTRRQGIEAQAEFKADKYELSASYAYIDATFLDSLTLASNSPAANPFTGTIQVQPGDQIPMIPHNRAKLAADYSLTSAFKIGAELYAVGTQYLVGDASNQEPQLPGYAVVNASASYKLGANLELYARAENLLDHHYYTFGTFFDVNNIPNFANGGAAFVDPRSLSPAAPQAFYAGMKATF